MSESPPIGKWGRFRSRLNASLLWWLHRRRLTLLALVLGIVVGAVAWATPQVRAWPRAWQPAEAKWAATDRGWRR